MRLSAFCAVLWLACATALTVPEGGKIEKKLAKRDDPPRKYWRKLPISLIFFDSEDILLTTTR